MTTIMGATYPDVFAALAVGAGLEYKAATTMSQALTAMSSGGPNPVTQGELAYKAMANRARPLGVIVIHGTSDYTVNIINGNQVIAQYVHKTPKKRGKKRKKRRIKEELKKKSSPVMTSSLLLLYFFFISPLLLLFVFFFVLIIIFLMDLGDDQ